MYRVSTFLLGMAEFQVLPPGLNQVSYKADTIDPNIFQITGTINVYTYSYIQ